MHHFCTYLRSLVWEGSTGLAKGGYRAAPAKAPQNFALGCCQKGSTSPQQWPYGDQTQVGRHCTPTNMHVLEKGQGMELVATYVYWNSRTQEPRVYHHVTISGKHVSSSLIKVRTNSCLFLLNPSDCGTCIHSLERASCVS